MSEAPVLDPAALARLRKLGGTALVRQMIELYLANGAERIGLVRDGAAAGDAALVERAAHTMKSSAGNLGAVHLQRSAEALESLAGAGRIDATFVRRAIADYEASEVALRRVLKELGE
jgi:HPt (histidine-containing phosphotransfer) domain-containing protein